MTLSTFGTQGRHMPLHRCQPPHRRPPPGADPPHPAHEAATSQAVGATPRNLNPTPSQSQGQCQRQRQRSRSWQSGKIGYLGDVELLSITNPYPVYMAFDAVRPASSQEGARASDYQESSSPEPREDGTNPPSRHRRGYQACQHCRDRKVKCDLGSVDAPHSPPCARCKRERLECQFAPTRKKLKRGGEETGEGRPGHGPKRRTYSTSQSEVKAFSPHGLQQPLRGFATANDFAPHPRWPGPPNHPTPSQSPQPHHETSAAAAFGRDAHLAGHKLQDVPSNSGRGSDVSVEVHSQIAAATFRSAVSSTQDNIMLLVDAANALPEDPGSTVIGRSLADRAGRARAISGLRPGAPSATPQTTLTPQEQEDQEQGLKAWSRMRFVRAGWFTASEAIQYVEYFYDRLAPMTPVVTRDFRSPAKHLALLTEEPVLALAILAIASRCMRLSGSAAVSRSYHIHDKLWTSLRSTVQRLLWGQEQLGGGFGGGGAAKMRQSNGGQFTWRGSLRTLGTIEALLLLTDWQPRALHFPPSDDDTRLLDDGSPDPLLDPNGSATMHDDDLAGGPSDTHDSLPYASWLEPAWRCDRMSLMLLGLAQALAFELGVFDTSHYGCQHQHGPGSDCVRKRRIRRLLLVYIAQTCGRMGIQSMIKVSEWENDPVFDQPSKEQGYGQAEEEDAVDIMQGCWLHIAGILEKANRDVFSSRQYTRELTSSGAYKKSISLFSGLLQEWKQHFDQVASRISPVMQSILLMEYQYSRLYINSLGLQNVVESWIEHGSNMPTTTLVKIVEDNKLYIDEVTDAALTILSLVVDGLAAKGHLRDAPIRIYLRSLSGMMFTLKRFSLGNHETMVRKSLNLLGQITNAMTKEVVDDVHLSSSTARLVQNIVKYVKQTLIRVQKPANGSGAASRDNSRHQSPHRNDNNTSYHQHHQHQHRTVTERTSPLPHVSPAYSFGDPLAEIEAKPMEEFSTQTFMPPPNFHLPTNDLGTVLPDQSTIDTTVAADLEATDWFALPLDNLWHNTEATVDQGFGGIGPTVGPKDMLELITNQDYNQMQWNGQIEMFGGGFGVV